MVKQGLVFSPRLCGITISHCLFEVLSQPLLWSESLIQCGAVLVFVPLTSVASSKVSLGQHLIIYSFMFIDNFSIINYFIIFAKLYIHINVMSAFAPITAFEGFQIYIFNMVSYFWILLFTHCILIYFRNFIQILPVIRPSLPSNRVPTNPDTCAPRLTPMK